MFEYIEDWTTFYISTNGTADNRCNMMNLKKITRAEIQVFQNLRGELTTPNIQKKTL